MELEPWLHAGQGVWRVIEVEDWAEIRRLHRAEGMGNKAIARRLSMARNTVRDALRSDEPPRYERVGLPEASVVGSKPKARRCRRLATAPVLRRHCIGSQATD